MQALLNPSCQGRTPPSTATSSGARSNSEINLSEHNFKPQETGDEPSNHTINILALQVQAFLDASEDVDIDVETVEDLIQTIEGQRHEGAPVNGGGSSIHIGEDTHDANVDLEMEAELDISALYATQDEAQQTWTRQEVKQMMHHLKERGMSSWIKEYVLTRNFPVPKLLHAFGINLCTELRDKRPTTLLYFLKVAMSRELRLREKLTNYNTIADAAMLIRSSQRIIILTGAGISVSCGIPDFRSRDGLYASLKDRGDYELDDPQQMFDINYFRENPAVFYSFASQIYPSNFIPAPCHRFIKLIEDKGKLLRNYTQNIDTLETLAGVGRVLQCHGSFATASCLLCRRRVAGSVIEAEILKQKVPLCTVCNPPAAPSKGKQKSRKKTKGGWDSDVEDESDGPDYPPGIMKPDITFFGEKLTDDFERCLLEDHSKVDLLLVIGTSLKVSPVSDILSHLPHSVPQILINKTPVRHINPDIVLLGNADDIVHHLVEEIGWELPPPSTPGPVLSDTTRLRPPRGNLKKRSSSDLRERQEPQRVGNSHVWLFEGAEGGKWVEDLLKMTPEPNSGGTEMVADSLERGLIKPVDMPRESKKPRFQ